jgi:hypothetical protein
MAPGTLRRPASRDQCLEGPVALAADVFEKWHKIINSRAFSCAGWDAMSDEGNALLALKNAWAGVVAASAAVRDLDVVVQALPAETPLAALDLERYHHLALAEANAIEALRGLIEQMRDRVAG